MSFRDSINGIFKDKKRILAVLLLALLGLILIFASAPSDDAGAAVEEESLDEYKARLESELAALCTEVEGVGSCRVMISLERGWSNTYKGSSLVESSPPRVMGVSIICTGGERAEVRAELTSLVSSLFGIGANRVSVSRMRG